MIVKNYTIYDEYIMQNDRKTIHFMTNILYKMIVKTIQFMTNILCYKFVINCIVY